MGEQSFGSQLRSIFSIILLGDPKQRKNWLRVARAIVILIVQKVVKLFCFLSENFCLFVTSMARETGMQIGYPKLQFHRIFRIFVTGNKISPCCFSQLFPENLFRGFFFSNKFLWHFEAEVQFFRP